MVHFANRSNYWNKVHFVGSLNFAEIWFAILIVCFVSKSFRLVYLGLKLKNNNNMTVHTLYIYYGITGYGVSSPGIQN